MHNGRAVVSLGKPAAGRYAVTAVFAGSASLAASTSKKATLVVKK